MIRSGIGWDSHRLEPGRRLILGGIELDYERGLAGHSDGDVLTHAVMDALLGAAGCNDIGQWFPDSDPQYKDADSIALLRVLVAEMEARGVRLIPPCFVESPAAPLPVTGEDDAPCSASRTTSQLALFSTS